MISPKRCTEHKFRVIFALAVCLAAMLMTLAPSSAARAEPDTSLRLIQSSSDSVILELEVSHYTLQLQKVGVVTYSVLSIADLPFAGSPGKPRLPVQGALVGIPPGAQAKLRIISDDVRRDALSNPPLPETTTRLQFDPTRMLPRQETDSIMADPVTYASSPGRIYPTDVARIGSSGNWRSQPYVAVEFYPLQYDPAAHQLVFHRRLRVEITFTYSVGAARTGVAVKEGPLDSVLQANLINYDSARSWRTSSSSTVATSARSMAHTGGPWFKVAVGADGMYKISCAMLRDQAGLNPSNVDPSTFKIYKRGTELAIASFWAFGDPCDDSHYLLFFGRAVKTKYTDTNTYWLTYGGLPGRRVVSRDGIGTEVATAFTDTLHLERDLMYRNYFPMQNGADHWFWNYLSPGYAPPYYFPSRDYSFQVENPVSAEISPTVQLDLWGYTAGGHHTQVFVNNSIVYENTSWSGQEQLHVTVPFPEGLVTGDNTLRVTEVNDRDANDFVFVNSFDISYSRAFSATNDALLFRELQGGAWKYQISGFTVPDVRVFDVTSEFDMALIGNAVVDSSPCCTLTFTDTADVPRQYVALAPAQFKSPLSIAADVAPEPVPLHDTSNAADEIIISYGGFVPNLAKLKSWRERQKLPNGSNFRVKLVDVQDVYDEFSDGLMDPQAIRDFLAYAYAYWTPPDPSFVLLVGDGTFDPKGNCATPGVCPDLTTPPNSTLIPPFLLDVDPWLGETATDNRLVSFDDWAGNTNPFMAIGRLPVNNTAQVDLMVKKIIDYERTPVAGSWRTKMLFAADVPDADNDFWSLSDGIANDARYVPAPLVSDRIYYGQAPYTDVGYTRNSILSSLNSGSLVVNYVGHAAVDYWASGPLLTAGDASALTNGGRLPVMLDMTCFDGYFVLPGADSLAEAAMGAQDGGALASWAPSGWGQAAGHDLLNRGFLHSVFWSGSPFVGSATISGKMYLWLNGAGRYRDLIDTFNLLGDPASRMNIPPLVRGFIPFIAR